MCQPDIVNLHGVKSHDLGSHGVNSYAVRAGQDEALLNRNHCPGSWTIAAESTVHYCKDPGVYLLLNRQQVHQGLMDDAVGVMAVGI